MWFLVPVVLGQREAAINVAEGKKQSQILASEARRMEQINIATGNQLHLICYQNLNLNMLVLPRRRWQDLFTIFCDHNIIMANLFTSVLVVKAVAWR